MTQRRSDLAPPTIDLALLGTRLNESLGMLRDTYTSAREFGDEPGGGWYHELETPAPGATATALGLLTFVECGRTFEHFDEGLAFLKARQTLTRNALTDGGWATKTSLGLPVVEATAWIARFLARARCGLRRDAPDLRKAHRWLVVNQNPDGGWGSLHGCPSRVWLTCLALRALTQLNPYDEAVRRGGEWLLAHRSAGGPAWGPTRDDGPTVTHTAFALLTLAETWPEQEDDRLPAIYDWLRDNFDPRRERPWIETYNVSPHATRDDRTWRLALWHYGLPIALSALLRDPRGVPGGTIAAAFETIARGTVGDQRWMGYPGPGRTSLWSLWWCLEALTDLTRHPLARPGDALIWLPQAVVIRRAAASSRPLQALLPGRPRIDLRAAARRHWTAPLLATVTAIGLAGVATGTWEWKDFWLSAILPATLTVIQETVNRRRGR